MNYNVVEHRLPLERGMTELGYGRHRGTRRRRIPPRKRRCCESVPYSLPLAGYLVGVLFQENALSTMCKILTAWAVGVLWIPAAIAAGTAANTATNASGALPGDDALTCEQIYAQGMAESQRDQRERDARQRDADAE